MFMWNRAVAALSLSLLLAGCASQPAGENSQGPSGIERTPSSTESVSAPSSAEPSESSAGDGEASPNTAADTSEATVSKNTLVIVSHPNMERSTYTKGLAEAASAVDGVTVRHLDELYGTDLAAIDVQAETELMEQADRVVFIFPTYWFNVTPMLKGYLDAIWGGVGPSRWEGKELLVVSHAGGGNDVYGENGSIGMSHAEVFAGLEASAAYAGMIYLEPLLFEAGSASEVPSYQEALISRLQDW